MESDTRIEDIGIAKDVFTRLGSQYDIVFLGSFNGRAKLKRSSVKSLGKRYRIGTPVESTMYCAYGYAINRAIAAHLLRSTRRVAWPVNYWQKWFHSFDEEFPARVGAVVPEVVSTWSDYSSIQDAHLVEAADKLPRRIKDFLADMKHSAEAFWN